MRGRRGRCSASSAIPTLRIGGGSYQLWLPIADVARDLGDLDPALGASQLGGDDDDADADEDVATGLAFAGVTVIALDASPVDDRPVGYVPPRVLLDFLDQQRRLLRP